MSKKSYAEQRSNAKARGIPFWFTYEEWVEWWQTALGPDWKKKRGRKKGQFCMARLGDTGAYEPSNVECISVGQNKTEASENDTIAFGAGSGKAVLNDEIARDIYLSTDTVKGIAARYGVSVGTVIDIRANRTWVRATLKLVRQTTRGRNQWTR